MTRHSIDNRLSLVIPEDWEIWDPTEDVLFVAAAPDIGRDDLQPHLFVTRSDTTNESSRDSLVGNVAYLNEHCDGYEVSGAEEFMTNGLLVVVLTFDAPAQEWTFTNRNFFVVVSGLEYHIACKMLPEQVDRWMPEFDIVARSIEFRP